MNLAYPKARGVGYHRGSVSVEAATRGEDVALSRNVLIAKDLLQGCLFLLSPRRRLNTGNNLSVCLWHRRRELAMSDVRFLCLERPFRSFF